MYGDFTLWKPETTPTYVIEDGKTVRYVGEEVMEYPSIRIPVGLAYTPIPLKRIPDVPESPVNTRSFLPPSREYYKKFHEWEKKKLEWNNKQGNLRIAKSAHHRLGKTEYVDSDSIYSGAPEKPSILARAKTFFIRAAIVLVAIKVLTIFMGW